MIERIKDKLLISVGNWYILKEGIYLGNINFLGYKLMERKLNWIKNDRIRIYILLKMIQGDTFREAMNRVLTKEHFSDNDYRGIMLE